MKTSEDYEYTINCLLDQIVRMNEKFTELIDENYALKRLRENDVWYWCNSECNYLDSMGNKMVVLIYASDLKELLKGNDNE